jgi:hypothetical protein
VESARHTWNDERMDEFAERTEENFREVRREVREVRGEIRDTRTELRDDIQRGDAGLRDEILALRVEMNERFAGLERRFDILFGALATGFVGAVVAHFIG